MKQIFTILFLLSTLLSFGQTYYPFPDSIGVWRETSEFGSFPSYKSNYSLFINGDTIINSNRYSKLYNFVSNTTSIIDTVNSTYYGAIREVNKKIYFFPDTNLVYGFCYEWLNPAPNYSEDILLYDFDVSVGDTVVYPHLDSAYIIINSIDSVLVGTNYRKRYNHSGFVNTTLNCGLGVYEGYVEGIGNHKEGLFSLLYYYFENAYYLRCFEDENDFYQFYPSINCLSVSINEINELNNIYIYPNPASEKIIIETKKKIDYIIKLYDISGKLIYISEKKNKSTSLSVGEYNKGLYIVKIETKNNSQILKLAIE